MIGEQLGNYRVVAKVGEGGMGAVYLAEHQTLGRRAAIKVLLHELSSNPEVLRRFFNEARAATRLRHPAFVDVFDYGSHAGGQAYIVMDYLEGETVSDRLGRLGRMPVAEAIEVARQIAAAMAVAHTAGIIHRDLKPENVFLIPDPEHPDRPRVKILDFGVAKLGASSLATSTSPHATRAGMILGTPIFMAPEQCRGAGEVDARADVYALAAIVFTMLCGRPPFVRASTGELIAAHLMEPPPSPASLEPSVPPELDQLVLRGLAKDPSERPQTMKALERELAGVGEVVKRAAPAGGVAALPIRNSGDAPEAVVRLGPATGRGMSNGGISAGISGGTLPLMASSTTLSRSAVESEGGTRRAPGGGRWGLRVGAVLVIAAAGVGAVMLMTGGNRGEVAAERVATPPKQAAAAPSHVQPIVPEREPPTPAPRDETPPPNSEPAAPPPTAEPPPPKSEVRPTAAPTPATIRVTIANALPGLEVILPDGRTVSPPVILPRDGASIRLRFKTAGMEDEEKTIRADRNQRITLKNQPALIIQ